MKLRPSVLVLLLATLVRVASATTPSERQHAGLEQQVGKTLSNGLHVEVGVDRRVPVATLVIDYDVGIVDDPEAQLGMARLVASLLDGEVTRHFPEGSRRSVLDMAGVGDWTTQAAALREHTVLSTTVPRSHLPLVLFFEAEKMGFRADGLAPWDVEPRGGLALSSEGESGGAFRGEALPLAFVFGPKHPYATSLEQQAPPSPSLAEVRARLRQLYCPGNATVLVTGDLDPQLTLRQVEEWFGALPACPNAPPAAAAEPWEQSVRATLHRKGQHPDELMIWVTPAYLTRDDMTLDVIARALSIRLQKRVKEFGEEARAHAAESSMDLQSVFTVWATGVPAALRDRWEATVSEELARLANVSDDALLHSAKARLTAELAPDNDEPEERGVLAARLARLSRHGVSSEWRTGPIPSTIEAWYRVYSEVKQSDLAAVVRRYLSQAPRVVLVREDAPAGQREGWSPVVPARVGGIGSSASLPPVADDLRWYRPPSKLILASSAEPPFETAVKSRARLAAEQWGGNPVSRITLVWPWVVRGPRPTHWGVLSNALMRAETKTVSSLAERLESLGADVDWHWDDTALTVSIVVEEGAVAASLDEVKRALSVKSLPPELVADAIDRIKKGANDAEAVVNRCGTDWGLAYTFGAKERGFWRPAASPDEEWRLLTPASVQALWRDMTSKGSRYVTLSGPQVPSLSLREMSAALPAWASASPSPAPHARREVARGLHLLLDSSQDKASIRLTWKLDGSGAQLDRYGILASLVNDTRNTWGLRDKFQRKGIQSVPSRAARLEQEGGDAYFVVELSVDSQDCILALEAISDVLKELKGDVLTEDYAAHWNRTAEEWLPVDRGSGRERHRQLVRFVSDGRALTGYSAMLRESQRLDVQAVREAAGALSLDRAAIVVRGPLGASESGFASLGLGQPERVTLRAAGKETP